ncbi:hypothetical protein BRADO5097 [Bradyrhizobium sp. ORS 278]|uniref:DUF3606 domain-containing protein n=1 Tax=Bradyrhizobium sp. (strain ORS 278) TaxID=114615 RepID=UPI000150848D|nr:DUF3606 domain-containing protein [Bradyrhizobium sp. ORS 278]CAL78792.1 hypothetical protein BRADO5097 [Bradyrhizobium sp. ORS 278]
MRRPKIQPIRNKLDLTDRVQVRIVTRRLRVTQAELTEIVGRIGNSIAAISKEVQLQRSSKTALPADVPPAEVIASVTATETVVADAVATTETR